MAPKKRHTNNPKGRPKGTPNKVTSDIRRWVQLFVKNNRKQFESDLISLTPDQRVDVICKLLAYILPKPKDDIEVTDPNDNTL